MTLTLPLIAELENTESLEVQSFDNQDEDWTFHGASTRDLTHCYHDYPARMIPQIACQLLEKFGSEVGTLFDPYCGTGTSLVEGFVHGWNVVGTDLNPLARLIASTKTLLISPKKIDVYVSRLESFIVAEGNLPLNEVPEVRGISRLDFWFKPQVIEQLGHLRNFINGIEIENIRKFFQVAFSETVRECSNTRNNEFKLYRIQEEKLESFEPKVYATMLAKLRRNRNGLLGFSERLEQLPQVGTAQVFDFNTVDGIPSTAVNPGSVDLVLTSPPYGDSTTTVAYGQYSRLSAEWLGFTESSKTDRRLMGGKTLQNIPVFSSDALNAAISQIDKADEKRSREVAAFYYDLESSIENVAPLLRSGGHACYVVGNRRVKGVTLPTDDAVRRAFEKHGFDWVDTFLRTIPNKRMPHKNSPTNVSGAADTTMTREYIVVMERS